MSEITINISETELQNVVRAYKTLQHFLDKIVSPNEIYTDEFLSGFDESEKDVQTKNFTEVKSFADFIQ
jgi:hypothetical protein